jgi:hypothetical protein
MAYPMIPLSCRSNLVGRYLLTFKNRHIHLLCRLREEAGAKVADDGGVPEDWVEGENEETNGEEGEEGEEGEGEEKEEEEEEEEDTTPSLLTEASS